MLRDYQQRAIDDLYAWFRAGNEGNPCMVLPTGAGKSHILAALCKDAMQSWPDTRILLLSHVKEIIEQDAEKLRKVWPNAPLGIYSAGLGKRELGMPITFASVQSVAKRAGQIGRIDIVLVDESHRISHKNEGGYRKLINELSEINQALRVIGLTATPWRLGHGKIDEGEALFSDLLESVTITELVERGYLCPLRSKMTGHRLNVDGVHKRGGEYVENELQAAVDTSDDNQRVVAEIIERGHDRKSWLIFCTGVAHSEHICDEIKRQGITCKSVTGNMGSKERAETLAAFKAGELRAITNCDVLTTGFDHTGVDLIAMLRPTMSPSLYVQIAGRGMRIDSGKQDCLVLDFAGNIERHGPITCVEPPRAKGEGGDAPVKDCPQCMEMVHASAHTCPACGYVFPITTEKEPPKLSNADIMGWQAQEMIVSRWAWEIYTSQRSGKEMLKVRYYGGLSDPVVSEYVTLLHDGYAGRKAAKTIAEITSRCGVSMAQFGADSTLQELADALNDSPAPEAIEYRRDGKFYRVLNRKWRQEAVA